MLGILEEVHRMDSFRSYLQILLNMLGQIYDQAQLFSSNSCLQIDRISRRELKSAGNVVLQQLALFGHIVERCSSALLLSEEILSSVLLYSVRNGFDYRKKREAERSCEFIFRIDFCRNFYPEVLGTS